MLRKRRNREGRMPLRRHLAELRRRVILAAAGLVAGAVVGWVVYQPLLRALQRPLQEASAAQDKTIALNFTGVASAFDVQLKVSLFLGLIISCPWWLYQLWAFVTPGLTRRERRYTIGFLGAGIPFFLGGALLAWWMLPRAVEVLSSFVPEGAVNYTDALGYLTFVMHLVIAFGLAFVLPVILVALNFAGILSSRTLLHQWRWSVMIAFVFAAIITPTPDAITMIFIAVPICGLFFAAAGVAAWHDRRVAKRVGDIA